MAIWKWEMKVGIFKWPWWLIFVATLTELWGASDIESNIILGVFLWECLYISLTFNTVNWVKQIVFPRWVILQSVEDMKRVKVVNLKFGIVLARNFWTMKFLWNAVLNLAEKQFEFSHFHLKTVRIMNHFCNFHK